MSISGQPLDLQSFTLTAAAYTTLGTQVRGLLASASTREVVFNDDRPISVAAARSDVVEIFN